MWYWLLRTFGTSVTGYVLIFVSALSLLFGLGQSAQQRKGTHGPFASLILLGVGMLLAFGIPGGCDDSNNKSHTTRGGETISQAPSPATPAKSTPSATDVARLFDEASQLQSKIKSIGPRIATLMNSIQAFINSSTGQAGLDYSKIKAVCDANADSTRTASIPDKFSRNFQDEVQQSLTEAPKVIVDLGKQWVDLTGQDDQLNSQVKALTKSSTLTQDYLDKLVLSRIALESVYQDLSDLIDAKQMALLKVYRALDADEQKLYLSAMQSVSGTSGNGPQYRDPVAPPTASKPAPAGATKEADDAAQAKVVTMQKALATATKELNRASEIAHARIQVTDQYKQTLSDVAKAQAILDQDSGVDTVENQNAAIAKLEAKKKLSQLDSTAMSDPQYIRAADRFKTAQRNYDDAVTKAAPITDSSAATPPASVIPNHIETVVASPPVASHAPAQPIRNPLVVQIERKIEAASDPFLLQLDGELSRGDETVADELAEPARRAKIQQSPLARELIAAYQNDAEAFAKAEADEPSHNYRPVSQSVLDHIRQEIEHGAKVRDLLADPYTRQAAKNDPALQELIDEAEQRNGN